MLRRRKAGRRLDCPRVFHVDGTPVGDWRKTWAKACSKAGLPGKLFHDCRRTAVRNLDRAGVPRAVAMKITGHKTEAIYRRYNIVSDDDIREAGLKLARYVGGLSTRATVTPMARATATS